MKHYYTIFLKFLDQQNQKNNYLQEFIVDGIASDKFLNAEEIIDFFFKESSWVITDKYDRDEFKTYLRFLDDIRQEDNLMMWIECTNDYLHSETDLHIYSSEELWKRFKDNIANLFDEISNLDEIDANFEKYGYDWSF